MAALTTAKGVSHTKYAASGMANFVSQTWRNTVQMVTDEYTVPAGDTLAIGGVLSMGIVPKGARVLGFIFQQSGAGAASVGKITVGSTDATAAGAITDMTSASAQFIPALIAVAGTPLTADSAVTITIATADWDATTNAQLTTLYVQDGIGA